MDVDKLKAILAALQGTDVSRLIWVSGQETLDLRLGHPPPTTAVHAVPMAAPMAAPLHVQAANPHPPPAPAPDAAPPPPPPAVKPAEDKKTFTVNSPFVGTFYRSASPTADPFVRLGSHVELDTVVCIIEAMKLMNEIQAETSGEVAKIYVENGQPVEFGQPLFKIRPS